MAVSVRIEDEAFADERYEDLAHHAGLADADHARGKMAKLWRQCTLEQTHQLENQMVLRVLGPNGIEALIRARLADRAGDSHVRIRGTRGRIEWLQKLRENGQKGGRPRKSAEPEGEANGKPKGLASGSSELNPPAPAPAPTIEEEDPPIHPADAAIACSLVLRIVANHPGSKLAKLEPAQKDDKIRKWADHVRLMREVDKHSEAEIKTVLEWSQTDPFWRKNILSTEKLREKWDQLIAAMGAKAPARSARHTPSAQPKLSFQLGEMVVER